MLNRYKQSITDTDRIIREIRAQYSDGVFDFILFVIKKVLSSPWCLQLDS